MLIECNGADDCFGFPHLTTQPKYRIKHRFPKVGKEVIAFLFQHARHWKWKSHEGVLARILALADDHEIDPQDIATCECGAIAYRIGPDKYQCTECE